MDKSVHIKEIFTSIQGEGPFIGYKQLFIRFCGCNLNCNYCDTDFDSSNSTIYTINELLQIIYQNLDCHSISLTGGEPLIHTNFLKELLPKCNLPIYLETNATLYENLNQIIDYITYISADIKLPSCAGGKNLVEIHDKFFEQSADKILFAKIVFDKNITNDEIISTAKLAKKYNIELILQPMNLKNTMFNDPIFIEKIHNKYLELYKNTRVIPQMHKYLSLR